MALKGKRARFVLEVLKDGNLTQAAIRAGYSKESAYNQGSRLMRNDEVSAAVAAGAARILEKLDCGVERIIGEAVRVGLSDIRQVFDPETHAMLELYEMPEDIARAVSSVKVLSREVKVSDPDEGPPQTTYTATLTELKLWNKLAGLELLSKLKGLLKPQLEVDVSDTWKEVLQEMHAERVAKAQLEAEDAARLKGPGEGRSKLGTPEDNDTTWVLELNKGGFVGPDGKTVHDVGQAVVFEHWIDAAGEQKLVGPCEIVACHKT